jgi:NACalpha-BTF3-like transcription factor
LDGAGDEAGNYSNSIQSVMRVLVGDTNEDTFVNSADISEVKSQSGQAVTTSNFQEDLNADGFINSADISLVKSQSGAPRPEQRSRPNRRN